MVKVITHTTRITASQLRLWRALTDFAALPHWRSAVIDERCEPAGGWSEAGS